MRLHGDGVAAERLTIASWGGCTWGQRAAHFEPFTKQRKSHSEDQHNGDIARVKAMVRQPVTWVVVNMYKFRLSKAATRHPRTPLSLLGDPKDYLPGAVHRCGIASTPSPISLRSMPIAPGFNPPTKLADFFDLKKYPGKRG